MFWSKARKIRELRMQLTNSEILKKHYYDKANQYQDMYEELLTDYKNLAFEVQQTKPVRDSKGRFISKSITSAEVPLV